MLQAQRYLKIASEKGDAISQYLLAEIFSSGIGISEDKARAAHFYKQSADQAYAPAQYRLGQAYQFGRGCEAG